MPHYDFFCHARNQRSSKALTPAEQREDNIVYPRCGGQEVEQGWIPRRHR